MPFGRPRDRTEVLENADYYPLRERLLELLDHRTEDLPAESLGLLHSDSDSELETRDWAIEREAG